jgi:type III restriction enzyme
MPELMGLKNILALNDEAHHCYREKPSDEDEGEDLKGDERKEAERNNEAARLWLSGLEAVNHKLGLARVIDLSATCFFLRGSGYAEGILFPWTMCDFSLMEAIECGIVKLPRVPVAENIPGGDMPTFRNLWENIRKDMPKKGRGKAEGLDPLAFPLDSRPLCRRSTTSGRSAVPTAFCIWSSRSKAIDARTRRKRRRRWTPIGCPSSTISGQSVDGPSPS